MQNKITVEVKVEAPVEKVWEYFNDPVHITKWGQAAADWHTPQAENDLTVGGKFDYRMESKDGKEGFNFVGTYDEVIIYEKIAYTIADGRKVEVLFKKEGQGTEVTETFEPENENSIEMQKAGWQAILNSFKKHTEEN